MKGKDMHANEQVYEGTYDLMNIYIWLWKQETLLPHKGQSRNMNISSGRRTTKSTANVDGHITLPAAELFFSVEKCHV